MQRSRGQALKELKVNRRSGRTRSPTKSSESADVYLVPLTGGHVAIIDACDAIAVGAFNWQPVQKGRTIYAKTSCDGADVYLHLFLWKLWGRPPAPEIDHEDGDGLDNRSANLRAATPEQNRQNTRVFKSTVSGIKGVHFDKITGKWRADIGADGKRFRLGRFESLAKAAMAVSEARSRLHGRFANDGSSRFVAPG